MYHLTHGVAGRVTCGAELPVARSLKKECHEETTLHLCGDKYLNLNLENLYLATWPSLPVIEMRRVICQ